MENTTRIFIFSLYYETELHVESQVFFISGLLSLLPISELRGAIPFALTKGMPLAIAYVYCVFLNALVGPLVFIFLSTLHKLFCLMSWYRKVFDAIVIRARKKITDKVEKYGYWGVVLFVSIPLPITGAYTGTLGAWVLGLDPKKTFLSVLIGVCIAGVVVSLVTYFGLEAFSIFIKNVHQ